MKICAKLQKILEKTRINLFYKINNNIFADKKFIFKSLELKFESAECKFESLEFMFESFKHKIICRLKYLSISKDKKINKKGK